MKCSKAAIHRKTHRIPEIKFEDQRLTSFAGLVVYQSLLSRIGQKRRLGEWEGDTVIGKGHRGALVMLVERKQTLR